MNIIVYRGKLFLNELKYNLKIISEFNYNCNKFRIEAEYLRDVVVHSAINLDDINADTLIDEFKHGIEHIGDVVQEWFGDCSL